MLKNLLKAIARGAIFAICWWAGFAYTLNVLRPVSLHAFWQGFIFMFLFLLCLLPYTITEDKLRVPPKGGTWPGRIAYFIFFLGAGYGSFYFLRTALPHVSLEMPQPSWPNTAYALLGLVSFVVLLISVLFTYRKLRLRAQKKKIANTLVSHAVKRTETQKK